MKRIIVLLIVIMLIATISSACSKPLEKMTAVELLDLGEKHLREMEYAEAIIYFDRLIEIEPRNVRGYTGAAEARIKLGKTDEALEVLQLGYEAIGDTQISDIIKNFSPLQQAEQSTNSPQTEASQQQQSVDEKNLAESIAFEQAYDEIYGWDVLSDFYNPVIIIYPDMTMLFSTNELDWMDIHDGKVIPDADGLSFTCVYSDYYGEHSFRLAYQNDELWAIEGAEESVPFGMYKALFTSCDLQEALRRIDEIKNTVFEDAD